MTTDPTSILISNKVIAAIRDALFLPNTRIEESTRLREDLGVDSLDLMEAFIDMEADFGIEFPTDAPERFRTVGNVVAFLRNGTAAA